MIRVRELVLTLLLVAAVPAFAQQNAGPPPDKRSSWIPPTPTMTQRRKDPPISPKAARLFVLRWPQASGKSLSKRASVLKPGRPFLFWMP